MTLEVPTLLAFLGTALTAVAILAPRKLPAPLPTPLAAGSPALAPRENWRPAYAPSAEPGLPPVTPPSPTWPELVDPRAAGVDPTARRALIEALGSVHAGWARAVLQRALDDESEPALREAIRTQLRG
jgi:hypothetical protein